MGPLPLLACFVLCQAVRASDDGRSGTFIHVGGAAGIMNASKLDLSLFDTESYAQLPQVDPVPLSGMVLVEDSQELSAPLTSSINVVGM